MEKTTDSIAVKALRAETGLSQVAFAKKLGIPRRTIENWESGVSAPPPYVVELIRYKLEHENMTASGE